ncbi:hypothetical protein HJFPF1_09164 [Paramyrothecium foliicola]|nr:hypothetical protein HJFPF1_09164 [Paramyrothecium foliicola]
MHFKAVSLCTVALAATGVQAMGASELIGSIGAITDMSNAVISTSEAMDVNTAQQKMPDLANTFGRLIHGSIETVSSLDEMERTPQLFTVEEQGQLCDAVKTSVDVAQDVVRSVLGTEPAQGPVPFAHDMYQVLRVVEKSMGALATGATELAPACGNDVDMKLVSMRDAMKQGAARFEIEDEEML